MRWIKIIWFCAIEMKTVMRNRSVFFKWRKYNLYALFARSNVPHQQFTMLRQALARTYRLACKSGSNSNEYYRWKHSGVHICCANTMGAHTRWVIASLHRVSHVYKMFHSETFFFDRFERRGTSQILTKRNKNAPQRTNKRIQGLWIEFIRRRKTEFHWMYVVNDVSSSHTVMLGCI